MTNKILNPTSNIYLISIVMLLISFNTYAQNLQTRYVIKTTLNGTTTVVYEENYGSLKLTSNTGDLIFTTNLANFKTGDKQTDSLLKEQEQIMFTFQANLGQNYFGIVNQQNDDKYHKVIGTIVVDNISYRSEALVNLENLTEKSNLSKTLIDLNIEVNPKIVKIPILSDFFKNTLQFQVENGLINQNN